MTDKTPTRGSGQNTGGGKGGSTGDSFRDARLALALKHMPDAHLQPDPKVRQAVLQAALQAVAVGEAQQATQPKTWRPQWQAFWHWLVGQPGHRMPLTGAVASVLVASFITLMWHGQEVPEATPEHAEAGSRHASARREAAPPVAQAVPVAPPAITVPTVLTESTEPAPPRMREASKKAKSEPAAQNISQDEAFSATPQREQRGPSPDALPQALAERHVAPAPAPAPAAVVTAAPPQSPKALAAPMPAAALPAEAKESLLRQSARVAASPQGGAPKLAGASGDSGDTGVAGVAKVAVGAVVVVLEGQQRTLSPAAGTALLAALRALPYQRSDAALGALGSAASPAPASVALAKADGASTAAAFTVQAGTGEVWQVSPGGVRVHAPSQASSHASSRTPSVASTDVSSHTLADSTRAYPSSVSALTPAQWAQLQALARSTAP